MMLEAIIGSRPREQVLQFILTHEEGYATEIAKFYSVSIGPIQKQLKRLEKGGVFISKKYGNTYVYRFSLRYAFLEELIILLKKVRNYYEPKLKEKLLFARKRPRRKDKPL